MHGPLGVPKLDHPQRHLLDQPALPRHLDHVPNGELVLEQDKEPADDVLHQALRPEGHGEPENAGAGQDGPDVDEDVEGEQESDGEDDHPSHAPEELGDRLAAPFTQRGDRVIAVVDGDLDPPGRQSDQPVREPRQEPDAEHSRTAPDQLLAVDPENGGETPENFTESEERDEVECEHRPGSWASPNLETLGAASQPEPAS